MSALTPDQLTALRDSLQSRSLDGTHNRLGVAFIVATPNGAFALHACGRVMAESADGALLCAALQAERAEPGWLARVCDPTLDPTAHPYTPEPTETRPAPADVSIEDLL